MGLGDWLKDKADDAGDWAENAFEEGKKTVGGWVDDGSSAVADVLDRVGLEGAADFVENTGDDIADSLGDEVAERQLGDTEDPKQLVHGEVERIHEVATHLTSFSTSMASAATGLAGIDAGGWTGSAADGFEAKLSAQPGKWRTAADACGDAAKAWTAYASTVTWAQGQARSAIQQYDRGKKASDAAVKAHNDKVDTWNRAVAAGTPTDQMPADPGTFTDPGKAEMEAAQHTLDQARKQRDEAAQRAASTIRAATAGAPQEPAFTDRMAADASDALQAREVMGAHVLGGIVKGTGGLVKFVRGLNPTDPYNMRHPAAYLEGLSNTATGLIHTANHPVEAVSAIIGSGWTTDPAEAFGELLPNLVGTIGTDGAGAAASVATRVAERGAVDALERGATRGLEDAAERGATRGLDDLPTHPDVPTAPRVGSPDHMSEWAGPDFRKLDDQLSDPSYHASNREIIENDYDVLGGRRSSEEFKQEFRTEAPDGSSDWDWEKAAPNDGAVPGSRQVLDPDQVPKLDRIGGDGGSYFGRDGDSFGSRSLPPDRLNFERRHWEIDLDNPRIRDGSVRVEQSEVAPAFGQHGGGMQYRFLDENGKALSQGDLRTGDHPLIKDLSEGAGR
ncbi:MAG: hypothetical protein JWR42_2336 [Marmoricola sp.]|nr:hypothetical protein [Marmoricola sp.]